VWEGGGAGEAEANGLLRQAEGDRTLSPSPARACNGNGHRPAHRLRTAVAPLSAVMVACPAHAGAWTTLAVKKKPFRLGEPSSAVMPLPLD